MSLKYLTTLLLGIGLLACTPAAQGAFTIVVNPGGGDNNNSGGASSPKTYAILVGSRAPSNGVADAIRGDLDVDHVAAQLSWASEVVLLKYQWSGVNSVAGDIQSAAANIAAKINPGDSFIFYYSGHGTGGSAPGVQDFINPVSGPGYRDDSLTAAFADSRFANVKKLFVVDSCHSEGIWKNDSADDRDLQTLGKISFLASSSEDGVAFSDTAQNGTSFFTNAILPALTPDATFGSIMTSATAANGPEVSGYFKDDGFGTGVLDAVGYTSADFDRNATLGGGIVPEPATWVLLLGGAAAILMGRRKR